MKKIWILISLVILLLALSLWADDVREAKLFDGRWVQWSDTDAKGKYTTADSAGFDGSGLDDMGVTDGNVFDGAIDSVVVIKIVAANYIQNDTAVSEGATDLVFQGTYTDVADSFFAAIVLTANYTKNDTAAIDADAAGLDDVTISGTYAGTADSAWCVQILDNGTDPVADTIKFGRILGADTASISWTDTAILDAAPDSIEVGDGMIFVFADSTGHTTDDKWSFYGYGYWGDSIAWISDAGADTTAMDYTDTMILSGDTVHVSGAEVYLAWDSIAGHDVGDIEVFKVYGFWGDSIAYGMEAGADTTGIALGDTAILVASPDSVAITTGEIYAIFDSIAGHTLSDCWVVLCYAEDRDTIWSTSVHPVRMEYSNIRVRTRVWADGAATDDTIIHALYNSFTDDSSSFYLVGSANTITGATINDTTITMLKHGSTTDSTFGKFWKQVMYLCGQEADTIGYNFDSYIQGW